MYDCYESDDLLCSDGIDMEKWELSSQIKGPKKGYFTNQHLRGLAYDVRHAADSSDTWWSVTYFLLR